MSNEVSSSIEVKEISEIFKSWFTEEELKIMEEKYNQMIKDNQSTIKEE